MLNMLNSVSVKKWKALITRNSLVLWKWYHSRESEASVFLPLIAEWSWENHFNESGEPKVISS